LQKVKRKEDSMETTYISFELIKTIPMVNVIEHLGGVINRSGFCECPFHNEKTPSMKVYNDHAYCFGCGKRIDGIAYAAKILGVTVNQAALYLAKEFGVTVNDRASSYTVVRKELQRRAQLQKQQEIRTAKINASFRLLGDYIQLLNAWEKYLPINDPRYIWAIHHIANAEYVFDELISLSDEQKITIIDFLIKENFFTTIKEIINKTLGGTK